MPPNPISDPPYPATLARVLLIAIPLTLLGSATPSESEDSAVGTGDGGFGEPMISYRQEGVHTDEAGPHLRIWDDGRVEVGLPSYHVRAGRYAGQMEPGELAELLVQVRALGLDAFHAASVRARSLELAAERGDLFHATGAGWSLFELRLDSEPISISWRGLGFEARAYPENRALGRLAEAESLLIALMSDPRWQRIEGRGIGLPPAADAPSTTPSRGERP